MKVLLLGVLLAACGPSIDDQIERLVAGGEQRDTAIQELLLRPDRAVGPLLEALENPDLAKGHADIAEALVSLMLRVDDETLVAALKQQLGAHPNARVRARIAFRLGMLKRADFIAELVAATGDPDGEVSAEAFRAEDGEDGRGLAGGNAEGRGRFRDQDRGADALVGNRRPLVAADLF